MSSNDEFDKIDAPIVTESQVYAKAAKNDLKQMLAGGYSLRGLGDQVRFKIDKKGSLYCLFRGNVFSAESGDWTGMYEDVINSLQKQCKCS
jgi:hypothetical protein